MYNNSNLQLISIILYSPKIIKAMKNMSKFTYITFFHKTFYTFKLISCYSFSYVYITNIIGITLLSYH